MTKYLVKTIQIFRLICYSRRGQTAARQRFLAALVANFSYVLISYYTPFSTKTYGLKWENKLKYLKSVFCGPQHFLFFWIWPARKKVWPPLCFVYKVFYTQCLFLLLFWLKIWSRRICFTYSRQKVFFCCCQVNPKKSNKLFFSCLWFYSIQGTVHWKLKCTTTNFT
jgi:hypothetical protein